ncbi:hypothetical protein N431DRAFT_440516 [Stipitochalara longipes BDJ]|nr:hypothetical protein N431DRAFT_440516 [Stipitochalara longipes BDJ]
MVRFVQSLLRSTSRRRSWETAGLKNPGRGLAVRARLHFRFSETGQGPPVDVLPAVAWRRPCIPAAVPFVSNPCQLKVESRESQTAFRFCCRYAAGTARLRLRTIRLGLAAYAKLDVRNGVESSAKPLRQPCVSRSPAERGLGHHFHSRVASPRRSLMIRFFPAGTMANNQPRALSNYCPREPANTSRAAFPLRGSRAKSPLDRARICRERTCVELALSSSIDAYGCFENRDGRKLRARTNGRIPTTWDASDFRNVVEPKVFPSFRMKSSDSKPFLLLHSMTILLVSHYTCSLRLTFVDPSQARSI